MTIEVNELNEEPSPDPSQEVEDSSPFSQGPWGLCKGKCLFYSVPFNTSDGLDLRPHASHNLSKVMSLSSMPALS